MIKKKIPGMSKKELLKAKAKNKLYNFILEDGQIRGALIHGTCMINEMRLNHELGILETLVLGHAYLGISLMTANLKEPGDQIAFKIECSGPIKGLSVEANAFGEVRGHLKNNPIPIEKPLESFDLSPFFGEGFLTVTRYPLYAKHPYVGHVKLRYGSISKDLAHYYLSSEQTPTAFHLSVKFDPEGNVTGAGGLFLQTMPETDHEFIERLEHLMHHLPSIGEAFSVNQPASEFIYNHFHPFSVKILNNRRMEFFCRCRKTTISQVISKLPVETLKDIVHQGPFPVEIRCHNCNTHYQFNKEEIEKFLKKYV
ncbi:MAG: Hsp33 family molecular chaperone HslO [Candidatus Aminicenantes bacterium]|nr:Hsp33 family molecular chaperone HslO [Candidatus Aminicenantes bacterium]NIM78019.1 Hsp33 family molecular chaperone HslO [Candidatus Aminicenantes bacterium]NIN17339.1 Hsp33 family molecular chaperone HslO [Candidatus Aminicenantes bacterium]NIN41231.1 Hsp33 family molecular chaperone HslO [Candidatus Aminicenantes bacterium]NIN84005.1 Hsp33 family molecular chaperone HslO [Candidatus Aminicenantes bacterium]